MLATGAKWDADLIDRRTILIAGPTASGKSAAGLRLARDLDGVIVNADSMQVYSDLRVLTARPDADEEAAAPHRLYGHVGARDAYSVARWVADVRGVLSEIEAAGQRAIFVGGTGLYFNVLTRGLSPIPDIDPEIREHWRNQGLNESAQDLHRQLMQVDPATAAVIRDSDPQRIVRALEVFHSTGRPLVEWQALPGMALLPAGSWQGLVVAPERAVIHERANRRFDLMLQQGALEEVRHLMEMQLSSALPVMRALGVAPLIGYLRGEMSLEAAAERSKAQTRQYIKRQTTWLRRNMMSWERLSS